MHRLPDDGARTSHRGIAAPALPVTAHAADEKLRLDHLDLSQRAGPHVAARIDVRRVVAIAESPSPMMPHLIAMNAPLVSTL
jgi:hypothetical protein